MMMEQMEALMGGGKGGGGEGAESMKKMENFWKYLDNLSETNPEEYKKFVTGQMKEGQKMHAEEQENAAKDANPEVWRVARTTGELGRKVVLLLRSSTKV